MTDAKGTRESYSFACLRCGHTWEQTYDIEHHLDREHRPFILYYSDGARVPSPLSCLTCDNCGEHTVRIMSAGHASAVLSAMATDRPPYTR
jgi:hypothetical protein